MVRPLYAFNVTVRSAKLGYTVIMNNAPINPEPLLKMGTAFWLSKVIAAAVQFEIFTKISDGHTTIAALSKALSMDDRSLRTILNACVATGLLKKNIEGYLNTELSDAFLVKGRPNYFGDLILMQGTRLYEAWGHLEETLRTGAPPKELFSAMRKDDSLSKLFTSAMHNNAVGTAAQAASKLDLNRFHKLMDVGGGSGAYAITFAQRNPQLSAFVVELPTVCKVADSYISQAALDGRVSTYPADIFRDAFPSGCDLALVSQVIHSFSPDECETLLRKIFSALSPKGMIIINEFFLNDDETSPMFSALFAVNMLLESENGVAYTRKAVATWLESAGFTDIQREDLPGPSGLLIATKK